MKKLIVCLTLLAATVSAQEATLTAPVAKPSEVKKTVNAVHLQRSPLDASVDVNVIDTNGNVARSYTVSIPSASIVSFLNGIMSSRVGETGGVARRFDYRALAWLKANGFLDDATVVP